MSKAKIEFVGANVKTTMKEAGAPSSDLWKVPPDQLRVKAGFNQRERTDAYKARVRAIADSIKEHGYLVQHPLTGYVAKEDGKAVIYVTGGHRRYEAVLLAMSEGKDIKFVPVVVPQGQSMESLYVDMVIGNDGEPLTVYEVAKVCAMLIGEGLDSAAIAAKLGYASAQYVDGLLSLVAAPLAIRRMVIEGTIKATLAIDTLRKHGDKAQDVLTAAATKAAGGKVTAGVLPEVAFARSIKKQAVPMFTAIQKLSEDKGFAKLSPEVQKLVQDVLESLVQ